MESRPVRHRCPYVYGDPSLDRLREHASEIACRRAQRLWQGPCRSVDADRLPSCISGLGRRYRLSANSPPVPARSKAVRRS